MKNNLLSNIIKFFLENRLILILMVLFLVIWGILVAPFDWQIGFLERTPVPVDAIPDIGENQQIVFTEWAGRSPQDVEDQITYPLTSALLGMPGVKTIRSYSMFGFSSIYVIFREEVEYYWSRSRVLEKLNSIPGDILPEGVTPTLGPDATALGQVFWYTLEGRDEEGNATGGWDLHELRRIQDWYVRYALMSAEGVSEVASVGGFEKEYQIDVDPDAMRAAGVTLSEVIQAIQFSNRDVGARTIEVNKVEYVIRGVGYIKSLQDVENAVIKVTDNVPLYVKNVAHVSMGPALRRGVLDDEGAEAVGGVVVVRFGTNPLQVIQNVKEKIREIEPGLPKKILADGQESRLKIVPFYDRTGLIYETLDTLNDALLEEILVTIIVVTLMVMNLTSSVLISGLLPLAVLMVFIAMKQFGVDANIVALSGIAIAIGTMVDLGIIVVENILKHLDRKSGDSSITRSIFEATKEVSGAVITAVSTTVVSFLPVFTMEAAEGKLFKPLAFTKTFALIASVIVALMVIPGIARILFSFRPKRIRIPALAKYLSGRNGNRIKTVLTVLLILVVLYYLSRHWMPLGVGTGSVQNMFFAGSLIGLIMLLFYLFRKSYERILRWALHNRGKFLLIPLSVIILGSGAWLGFDFFFGWLPSSLRTFKPVSMVAHAFPGLSREFMPSLNEGSFLLMPTTMPHASIGEVHDVLKKQNMAIRAIPEVDRVVGKLGRADSPLDPAPVSMIETVINYKSRYLHDGDGKLLKFRYQADSTDYFRDVEGNRLRAPDGFIYKVNGAFFRDDDWNLLPDERGKPFPLWRLPLDPGLNPGREAWKGMRSADDIWDEIIRAAKIPGTTSAPRLQPIETRLVMLQSGMRAPLGIKIKGPDLETIEEFGLTLERLLKEVPSIEPATVFADRIVGKPYLEIHIDRGAIARYGISVDQVQQVIETALGGKRITTTVEGRERYPVRIRYKRELRDQIESIGKILVAGHGNVQIPLSMLADIEYIRGPQSIKSEDTFLVGYVLFDKRKGFSELDVVGQARDFLDGKTADGTLLVPEGVSYRFAGSFENQVRAQKKLAIVLPLALFIIFLILYLQFRSVSTATLVFTGVIVAWAGGFVFLWLYGQDWFMNFSLFGANLRDLFQMETFNLSVAVWVGFLALFGIATDDGVLIATYLRRSFAERKPRTRSEVIETTVVAGLRRIRPALMTTATTVLALLPVLTSTGRGSDIMVPMAIPSFGGMIFAVITVLVVPVLYSWIEERKLPG